jgi:acetyl/propionyl-CoA carboxylase alpha subunit
VGWGFVAEHPAFAELCERLGIVFVGPGPDVMRALGDKIESKRLAEQAGVPVAPWSGGPVESVEDAQRHAETLGYPLMIKAAAGGGGRGMRRVDEAGELANAFERARAEAAQAFGDPSVLMERLVGAARHVEVQLLADGQGTVWALGVRDCSYQRRHQKVVEESASPALSPEQERELADAAVRLAASAGYRNAGTAEFLYEPASRQFSFMEVNARLQVEHPVTEMVTGVDLVRLQLHIAAGGRLEGEPPPPRGHAIEVRLTAEDPSRGFSPSPGRISLLRLPTGPGVRVDTGVAEGDDVPAEFDSMIAKIIALGSTREQAIARLQRAVADTIVALDEGTTNQGFLLELLGRPELRSGDVDTGWLDRLQAAGDVTPVRHADAALVQAAIALCDAATADARGRFYALARRGRPQADPDVGHQVDLVHRGTSYRLRVGQTGPGHYRVEVDGARIEAHVEPLSEHERRLRYGGRSHRTLTALQDQDLLVEVDGVPHRISRDEGGLIRSHAPGVVIAVPVSEGDEVRAGDVVAVTESMKMELSLTAPTDGRVREVLVSPNAHVTAGRPLLQIEALAEGPAVAAGERLHFEDAEADVGGLQRLAWAVLGYDVPADEVRRIVDDVLSAPADPAAEHRLLELYADVRALNRPHPDPGEAESMGSPQEHLHAYLRSLDAAAEGLPDRFVGHLERAVAHYGIDGLERTAALENAGYRLFLSQVRARPARDAVQAILTRDLDEADAGDGAELRGVLDRLETTLARREPSLAELARELRWRTCDEPLVAAAREETALIMEGHVAALAEEPARADRDERIAALVDCPEPLAPLLSRVLGGAGPLIEAMTRRYYRIRTLDHVEQCLVESVPFVLASYEHRGVRHHVAATLGDPDDLPQALHALEVHAATLPEGEPLLVDFYAREPAKI